MSELAPGNPAEFEFLQTKRVESNRTIEFPETLYDIFNPEQNPEYRIWWNYHKKTDKNSLVISERPLRSDAYCCKVDPTKIYKNNDIYKIRPPKSAVSAIDAELEEGDMVYYFAYNNILNKSNSAVFLALSGLLDRIEVVPRKINIPESDYPEFL